MKTFIRIIGVASLCGLALLPTLAFAQTAASPCKATQGTECPTITNFTFAGFLGIVNILVSWLFTLLLILAVVFVLFAAFKYLTSLGEPDKIQEATRMLIFAAVAIAVALLSLGVRTFVQDLLTQGGAV